MSRLVAIVYVIDRDFSSRCHRESESGDINVHQHNRDILYITVHCKVHSSVLHCRLEIVQSTRERDSREGKG